jgi:hypothetical protein
MNKKKKINTLLKIDVQKELFEIIAAGSKHVFKKWYELDVQSVDDMCVLSHDEGGLALS